jgi:hypothetical protein
VLWECALVEAAVQRARRLVAGGYAPLRTAASGYVENAAHSVTVSAHTTREMSGALVAQHRRFAAKNAVGLRAAGQTDAALHAEIAMALAIARAGTERLDAIATQTRATSQAGLVATTPAAQWAILTALRSQLDRTTGVVDSIRQQGAERAMHIGALQYEPPLAPLPLEPQLPTGPIVWCLRPRGTFGFYRCSILYPDLRVGTYWSPSDDTGGSLP